MRNPSNGYTEDCSNPIDAAVLADYWLGALAGSQEESVEKHLFECGQCSDSLREIVALAEGLRDLARQASVRMIVSDAFLERAAAEGLRVREYKVSPGGAVECTVSAEDDIVIGRLAADLREAKRVDLCICDENGTEQTRLPDIPVRAAAESIAYQESVTLLKAAPSGKMIVRLVSFDDTGAERQLGEYTFNHTRTLPGPGEW